MRIHIHLDEDLVARIDEIAGKRGRSAFIREAVEREAESKGKLAKFLAAVGSDPDFMRHLPDDWVRQERRRWTEASDRRAREAHARYDDPDRRDAREPGD